MGKALVLVDTREFAILTTFFSGEDEIMIQVFADHYYAHFEDEIKETTGTRLGQGGSQKSSSSEYLGDCCPEVRLLKRFSPRKEYDGLYCEIF